MKMIPCPSCGLKITDTHTECPKCQINIQPSKIINNNETSHESKQVLDVSDTDFKEEILLEAPQTGEATDVYLEPEESAEEIEREEENEDAFTESPQIEKRAYDYHPLIAALGYVFFFIPLFFIHKTKSKFLRFHFKQSLALFISTIVLFIGLLALRNFVDSLWHPVVVTDFPIIDIVPFQNYQSSFFNQHGLGIFLRTYLLVMFNILHVLPFAYMLFGIVAASQKKFTPLPLVRRLAHRIK